MHYRDVIKEYANRIVNNEVPIQDHPDYNQFEEDHDSEQETTGEGLSDDDGKSV